MTPPPDTQVAAETLEEIAEQLIATWFDAPDGYRGMVLIEEEWTSLRRLIVTALHDRDKRAAMIAESHFNTDAHKYHGDRCDKAIAKAIREGK